MLCSQEGRRRCRGCREHSPGRAREENRATTNLPTHTCDVGADSTRHHGALSDTTKRKRNKIRYAWRAGWDCVVTGSGFPRAQLCTATPAPPCKQSPGGDASAAAGDKYFEPPVKWIWAVDPTVPALFSGNHKWFIALWYSFALFSQTKHPRLRGSEKKANRKLRNA